MANLWWKIQDLVERQDYLESLIEKYEFPEVDITKTFEEQIYNFSYKFCQNIIEEWENYMKSNFHVMTEADKKKVLECELHQQHILGGLPYTKNLSGNYSSMAPDCNYCHYGKMDVEEDIVRFEPSNLVQNKFFKIWKEKGGVVDPAYNF